MAFFKKEAMWEMLAVFINYLLYARLYTKYECTDLKDAFSISA
jgi:hypothetical protein